MKFHVKLGCPPQSYCTYMDTLPLKVQGHVTVNKNAISIIYIVAHTCAAHILVDGVNPQYSYF